MPLSILVCRAPSLGAFNLTVFPVSGHMTAFIWPIWIVTSPVVLLVCAQYSIVLVLSMWGLLCGVNFTVGLLLRGGPLYWGLASILIWYCIYVLVGFCTCFHRMGKSVVIVPLCHMGWRRVFSGLAALVRPLGSW